MFKISVFSLFLILTSFALESRSEGQTNSQKYSAFDVDSPARNNFIFSENALTNERLKRSANRVKVYEELKQAAEGEATLSYSELKSGSLEMIDRGLNRPQELVRTVGDKSEVIFSNFQLSKKNDLRFSAIMISPDESKAALIFEKDGSEDFSYLFILDLNTKKNVLKDLLSFKPYESGFFWMSENHLLINDVDEQNQDVIKDLDLTEGHQSISIAYAGYQISESYSDETAILIKNKKDHFIFLSRNEPKLEIDGLNDFSFRGQENGKFYFTKVIQSPGGEATEIYTLDPSLKSLNLMTSFKGNITRLLLLSKGVVFVEQQGFRKSLNFYNFETGQLLTNVLPDFVSFGGASESENSNEINISVISDLKRKRLIWNTESNTVNYGDGFENEMLTAGDFALDVRFQLVPSFDGTLIPIRIVSLKGNSLHNSPAYIAAYGGFGAQQSLLPTRNSDLWSFIHQGGIYVGAGVRGGNEYGIAWHKAGMLDNKIKTLEDIASVAKYLIDSNISSKEKIVAKGRSNGGFVMAATGLLFPQYFGLVIAENGVLDMLAKEKLDARWDDGWANEYGDSRTPGGFQNLSKLSPLENINKAVGGTKFLIINGRKDSRVNPAHSIKFVKAAADLREQNQNIDVELISLNNSGHHTTDVDNDYIGLRARLVMWTKIYDQCGITFH